VGFRFPMHTRPAVLRYNRLLDLETRMFLSRKYSMCAVLALSLVTLTFFASAQDQKLSKEKQTQIESAVSKLMAATHVPGLSVGVVENGEYEWASGYGLADVENNSPASEHTLFRLASISKSLSATGVMQLVEHGKLDLDAPVQKYCPAFPQKPWPMTTRQVMGHLAGIRHYKGGPDDLEIGNTKHFDDPIQGGLNFFKDEPLLSEPGKTFHYSTQGYTLVGCVMEGAAGTKYVDYMMRNVFAPAGMEHTVVDNRFTIIPYRTRFYQKTEGGAVENAEFLDSSYKVPGGGWLSSAEDMAKFEVAILNDKLIKRTTRNQMWTALKPGDGSKDGYGLGWGNGDVDGVPVVSHTGGQQGTSTAFMIAPSKRVGVVVLTNMEGASAYDLAAAVMKILAGSAAEQKK
jgi:serine beta-lactamase-like protein LACTB, mitochondrial